MALQTSALNMTIKKKRPDALVGTKLKTVLTGKCLPTTVHNGETKFKSKTANYVHK